MKPDDLCIVDMDGKQISGKRKRSSEILLHLTIMKKRPDIHVVRPLPSAARHGVRRRPRADPQVRAARGRGLPRRRADHRVRDPRRPGVRRHGHAVRARTPTPSCWPTTAPSPAATDLTDAYLKTEIIDAYCRILMLAKQLGSVHYYSDQKAAELLKLKPGLGIRDVRLDKGLENCDLCGNSMFREGYTEFKPEPYAFIPPKLTGRAEGPGCLDGHATCACGSNGSQCACNVTSAVKSAVANVPTPGSNVDMEALVQAVTDQVMTALGSMAQVHAMPGANGHKAGSRSATAC